jgi:hypothetical protein
VESHPRVAPCTQFVCTSFTLILSFLRHAQVLERKARVGAAEALPDSNVEVHSRAIQSGVLQTIPTPSKSLCAYR